jgi:acetylornithine deacetylase/succinyl-diaminopimelate desuccinylase-like protein
MEMAMNIIKEKIDKYIEENLNLYIEELKRLCAQPSVSASGEGTLQMAEMIVETLEKFEFEVHKFNTPGNPIIVGKIDGKVEKNLLFFNHYDVQPPDPLDEWITPPFEPNIYEDALYARGAQDDKGEFLGRIVAVKAVQEAYGNSLPCGVTFVVEGEEEIGSPNINQFVQDHIDLLSCQAAVWEEGGIGPGGGLYNYLGVRGILSVELSIQVMDRDAHSGGAHMLPNAAWQLTWVLNSLKDEKEKILIEGFYDRVKPPAPLDLAMLRSSPTTVATVQKQFGFKKLIGEQTEKDFHEALFHPTCNIQGITTGYQGMGTKSVIPANASAKLDFRLVPDQDPEDILAKLQKHLIDHSFEDIKVKKYGMMWPVKISPDNPFVTLTNLTGEEVYGKPSTLIPMVGGSSPVYAFHNILGGIPVVRAGVRYWDNRSHAPNEHVRYCDFVNGAKHIARIIDGFAKLDL